MKDSALTIAGFDPSGGAGVLADVKTFGVFGLDAVAAITSVTFQNASQVFGASHQTGDAVRAQVLAVLEDRKIVCSKIGMLPTRGVVEAVARLFRESELPRPVVDPVMTSSSGYALMDERALKSLISELLPLARLLTPNVPEAERLTDLTITSEAEMRQAATLIRGMGAQAVLIKGGHLAREDAGGRRQAAAATRQQTGDAGRFAERESANGEFALSEDAIDLLDDGGKVTVFCEKRVAGAELHGSGCILSAAIAAGLGKGNGLEDSVGAAKSFVLEAIRKSGAVARPSGRA